MSSLRSMDITIDVHKQGDAAAYPSDSSNGMTPLGMPHTIYGLVCRIRDSVAQSEPKSRSVRRNEPKSRSVRRGKDGCWRSTIFFDFATSPMPAQSCEKEFVFFSTYRADYQLQFLFNIAVSSASCLRSQDPQSTGTTAENYWHLASSSSSVGDQIFMLYFFLLLLLINWEFIKINSQFIKT